jgi:tight adherence protein B
MEQLPVSFIDILVYGSMFAFFGIILLISNPGDDKKKMQKRLARVKGHAGKDVASRTQEAMSLRRQQQKTGRGGRLNLIQKIALRLEVAGMQVTAVRYIGICLCLIFLSFGVMVLFAGTSLTVAAMSSVAIGLGLPHFYTRIRINRRKKQFLLLFPDAIDLIVRGLRAGLPVTKSMQTVSEEISEPVQRVFMELVEQLKLGVNLDKALNDMAKQLDITEFNFFVTSVILQRETGGNLAEILENLANVLRQRSMMRLKIKAMSSEARASAFIVGSLPFLVFITLNVVSPEYLIPLYEDYRGNIAILISFGMLGSGVFIMMRMAKFEI